MSNSNITFPFNSFSLIFGFSILVSVIRVVLLLGLAILAIRALLTYIRSKNSRQEKSQIKRTLGEALREHRTRCQMTQEFVAESVGVSRQAVSKWERGDSDPSTSNLLALAKLFGVSAEELLRNVASSGEETDAE